MPINNIDTITMYSDDFRFIKPDDSETYLPSDNFEINSWNTWMRAFAYWMRDYFGFQITAGPGTSVGIIGRYISKTALVSNQLNFDNDWTNENFGVYPLEENVNVERVTSPFAPVEENGTVYYGVKNPDDSYTWNAKWGECNDEFGFDDNNNRFDIILTSQHYNNLGLRFKFPLTTTGIKQGSDVSVVGNVNRVYDLPGENLIFPYPSFLPTLNNEQIAKLITTRYDIDNTNIYYLESTKYIGFITILTNNDRKFIVQSSTKNQDSYYCPDFASNFNNQYYGWTPEFLNKLSSNFSFGYFRDYNKIKYIKSYDNQTLLIYITNGEKILTQFCFFKKSDHSSSLMIAEDGRKKKNLNNTWIKSNEYDFDHISNFNQLANTYEPSYGNFANIVINSSNKYHVTPLKNFKDIRGANTTINARTVTVGRMYYGRDSISENLNLVNNQGIWKLEPFNDNLSNGISSSLYLVTSAGDNELINENGKRIRTILNNKVTDFIVVPFNGAMIRENDTQDNSYLIAIPIYQEA